MVAQCILAFDYGLKAIGVAVGQTVTATASALPPLAARDGVPDWQQLATLFDTWKPSQLVVGLPLNMDGSASELSRRAEKFARQLQGRFQLPVATMDERLSSFEARGDILDRHRSRDFKRHNVDGLAAKLILESWLANGGAV